GRASRRNKKRKRRRTMDPRSGDGGYNGAPPRKLRLGRLFLLHQVEGSRVHAVAQAGGAGAVVEDVAEVATAAAAQDLGAHHPEGAVLVVLHRLGPDRLPEAGPAGSGVELGVAREQLLPAGGADEDARPVVVPVGVGEG